MTLDDRFAAASALLRETRDIVDERSTGTRAPGFSERRGWSDRLSALTSEELSIIERGGLAETAPLLAHLPRDLSELARAVAEIVTLPVATAAESASEVDARRAGPRKRAQVAAFAGLARELAPGASRIVDVGSGHGHLTRHLATALGIETEGWERDGDRVAVARSLVTDDGPLFRTVDVRERGELRRGDLVVGLHACGELADLAASAAASAGASLVLIGCCLQKRPGDRVPLSTDASLTLGRGVLGLGNARDGDDGVEADLATRAESRVKRLALRSLLSSAGLSVEAGEEMRGINRRRATGPLDELVHLVFHGRRLTPPSRAAIDEAATTARRESDRARRWEVPRTMLARLVEVWVALD